MTRQATPRLSNWSRFAAVGTAVLAACVLFGPVSRSVEEGLASGPPAAVPPLAAAAPAAPDHRAGTPATPPAHPEPEPAGQTPEEWRAGNDYVLRVQKTRTTLPGAAADGGPNQVDLLAYNGRLVGPTIRVRRGTTVRVKVVNDLPPGGAPPLAVDPDQEDPPGDLYTTNLHTHGLHVSPGGSSDNVFREIPPGGSFQYSFTIPADHPAGTFWYHPHKHGAVAYQLGNGLAGALIVEGGGGTGRVRDLEDVPEIAAARERVLVLQQLILQRDANGVGWVDPADVYNEPPRPNAYEVTAVNGVVLPTYTIQPGEVQRWRFVNAGRADAMMLRWFTEQGNETRVIPIGEIAVDGLARGAIWLRRDVTLYPGNRSDILIKAPPAEGTYYLTSVQENETPAPGEPVFVEKRLARLVVRGPARPMNFPASAALAACRPFEPIDAAECVVKRNLVLEYDDKKRIFRINGLSFSRQTRPETALLGTAEEWTLSAAEPPEGSADEPHPFHIHVNPFQVVRIENVASGVVWKADEWRDTVAVEKGKKVTIRVRFRDFAGKAVFHCHTLDHEDQGMMHAVRVVDPRQPDAGRDDPATQLTECRLPAPPLELPTARQTNWKLSDRGQRPVVLVFFRGVQCTHCVKELQKLLQSAGGLADTGTAVVAVSSEPIADPVAAAKLLGYPPGLDLTLLVDERHTGFRAFGCYDDGPRHGLFVIDRRGTVRARYVGDVPFADPKAVCACARRLCAAEKWETP